MNVPDIGSNKIYSKDYIKKWKNITQEQEMRRKQRVGMSANCHGSGGDRVVSDSGVRYKAAGYNRGVHCGMSYIWDMKAGRGEEGIYQIYLLVGPGSWSYRRGGRVKRKDNSVFNSIN